MPLEEKHPEYTLIENEISGKPCSQHGAQKLVDCFNDPAWYVEPVGIDLLKLNCIVCNSVRIYKLRPEKTLLRGK